MGRFTGSNYISLFPHTFGYPAVLSLVYRIFGPRVWAGQMLNILAGIGIAILLYQIGSILFNSQIGLWAALFWAFWPSQVLYSTLLATEALFTILMLLAIRFFVSFAGRNKKSPAALAGLGLLCAIANCIRPFGIVLILCFCFTLVLGDGAGKDRPLQLARRTAPCLVLAIAYFIAAWLLGAGLSGIIQKEIARFPVGFNLLTGSNIRYSGTWNIEDARILSSYTDHVPFDAHEVQNAMADMAFRRYRDQGSRNLRLFYWKYEILWASDDDILNYMKAGISQDPEGSGLFSLLARYLKLLCNLYYLAMTCLCLIFGIRFCRHESDTRIYAILLFILATAAAHLILEVAGRYHYPVMSLLSLLAGAGLEMMGNNRHSCRKRAMLPGNRKEGPSVWRV